MLIDTADRRHRSEGPQPVERWEPNVALWLRALGAVACLVAAGQVGPLPGYLLAMTALGLAVAAGVALLPRGDGLPKHRQ